MSEETIFNPDEVLRTIDKLRTENTAQAQEIDELKAHLVRVLLLACDLLEQVYDNPTLEARAEDILPKTPAQSLSAHDAAINADIRESIYAAYKARDEGESIGWIIRNTPGSHNVR